MGSNPILSAKQKTRPKGGFFVFGGKAKLALAFPEKITGMNPRASPGEFTLMIL
jgi:hypothetical protein